MLNFRNAANYFIDGRAYTIFGHNERPYMKLKSIKKDE